MESKAFTITANFWGAIDSADYGTLSSMFAPECEIVYPGQSSAFAGTYKGAAGAEELFKKLFVGVQRTATEVELMQNEDRTHVTSLIVEDGVYQGKAYKGLKWMLLFVVKGDAIAKAEIFVDTELAASLFPKQ
eukprot:PhM_4_TR4296/c0_g1_i2/m.78835/K06893/K06893; uncharacterized protein